MYDLFNNIRHCYQGTDYSRRLTYDLNFPTAPMIAPINGSKDRVRCNQLHLTTSTWTSTIPSANGFVLLNASNRNSSLLAGTIKAHVNGSRLMVVTAAYGPRLPSLAFLHGGVAVQLQRVEGLLLSKPMILLLPLRALGSDRLAPY